MAEISKIQVGQSSYDIVGGLFYGEVDSTSTSTAFTATISNLKTTTLYDGLTIVLKNGVVTSASGFTINVNNLGAKPVYSNMATGNDVTPTDPTRDTTIFNINYTMMFIYNSTLVDGGAWICYRGYDANTNTIGYQLRTNSGNRPMSDTAYRYRLYFTSADGSKWVPANTSTSTDATTSRTLNTRAIDPFGPIVYNSTNGTTNSGARPSATTIWQQYTLTIGYSYVKTLTAWDSVWLKCQPQDDGSAIMKDIVQALPSTNDGFIYIFLGFAYSTTAMELNVEHPVYYHNGTGIRLWTGKHKTSELTNDSGWTDNIGTITQVKTTAGAHAAINVTSGAANFNVPTKTSHLTNDSGFITLDEVPEGTVYGAGTGLTLSGSTFNHSNSITAQATQALYPIKYDAQGHITDAGTAVTSLPASDVSAWAKAANKPSYSFSEIGSKPTSISGYGITDAYTKTQVDGLVSGLWHFKDTVATISDLPASGNKEGDVYQVTANNSEYAWNGTSWVELGTTVDLSNYATHGNTGSSTTGISIADHSTTTITGVQASTVSVTGVQESTTTASKITTTSVLIPNITSVGSASDWVFEPVNVPIKATAATSIPNVTAAGSGSFTQGAFTGGSFTQGEDSFTPNVPTKIDTTKFSGGSFTQGTDSFTPNVPTKIDTTKFSGGSFTRGTFSGGSGSFTQGAFDGGSGSFTQGAFNGGSLNMSIDSTDSKKLNITFTAATHGADVHTHNPATHGADVHVHNAATHAADTFTAAKLNSGFYTEGTPASFTQGTDSFTPASFASGFYTVGTTASFTQGEDEFTPATHAADTHVHTPPTIGTPISIIGVQTATTTASHVKSGGNGTAPSLGTSITVTAVKSNSDVIVPIKATAATTVPVKNASATTVVTGKSHSITDPGHTHTI